MKKQQRRLGRTLMCGSGLFAWQEQLPQAGQHQKRKDLPRRVPWGLQQSGKPSLVGVALTLALGQAPALAATIHVDGTRCTLADAITAADNDTAVGGCPTGRGADTLVLATANAQTLAIVKNTVYGPTGLAVISNQATIDIRERAASTNPRRTQQLEEAVNKVLHQAFVSSLDIRNLATDKAIYGPDNRRNYDDPAVTPQQRRAADATAAIVDARWFVPGSHNDVHLIADPNSLCLSERFTYERSAAFCSGFKVGNRLIATAGHCIRHLECKSTRFIFGFYKTRAKPHPEFNIPRANVYSCRRMVDGELPDEGLLRPDWRVVEVDRNIAAPQVTIRSSAVPEISPGTALTVIGYPIGLPVKIDSGAEVLEVFQSPKFLLNSDTYVGHSGSAIFNSARLAQGELFVEGILDSGNPDFIRRGACDVSRRYPEQGGGPIGGEYATFASEIERALAP